MPSGVMEMRVICPNRDVSLVSRFCRRQWFRGGAKDRHLFAFARLLRVHPVGVALLRRHVPSGDDAVLAGKGDLAEGRESRIALDVLTRWEARDQLSPPSWVSKTPFLQACGKAVLAVEEPDAQDIRGRIFGFDQLLPDSAVCQIPFSSPSSRSNRRGRRARGRFPSSALSCPVGATIGRREDERAEFIPVAVRGEAANDAAVALGKARDH